MKLTEIIVNDFGGSPVAEHNMPCAVCWVNRAILTLNVGAFRPCWDCQKKFVLVKRNFITKFFQAD